MRDKKDINISVSLLCILIDLFLFFFLRDKKDINISLSLLCILIDLFLFLYNVIIFIGKQKCIQCDESKHLLDEKGMQYDYLDMTEMPHKTMTYFRMYCNSFPIVLNINHAFSKSEEILTHFNHI